MALWNEDLVVVNKYSRPGSKLLAVKGIVIHWTANPGGSDTGHKAFFDGDDGGGSRYAGCHFFVDSDSATLIIPLDEVAYHSNEKPSKIAKLKATAPYYSHGNANLTTLGIEMCVEKDGTIHADTVKRTVQITAHLVKTYGLSVNDIFRHYDITGKNCPAPWVANPALFETFKKDVTIALTPPKNVRFRTGWYNSYHAAKVLDFINLDGRNWYYKPIRNSDGTLTFEIEGFPEGGAGYLEMKKFLDDNGYHYTEVYI